MGLKDSVILVGELFPLNSKDTLLDSIHHLSLLSTRGHLSDNTGGQTHPLCFLALLGALQNRPSTLETVLVEGVAAYLLPWTSSGKGHVFSSESESQL